MVGEMRNDVKNDVKRFFNTYAACFGKMTERDGIEYYEQWLMSSTVNINDAITAVEILGQNWNGKFRPKLGQIKRAIQDSRYERKQSENNNFRYVPPDCDECKNSGLIMIVFEEGKEAKKFPCECPRGMAHNDEIFGRPKTFDDYLKVAKALVAGWKHGKSNKNQEECKF